MAQLRGLLYVGFIVVVVAGWFMSRRKNKATAENYQSEIEQFMPESLEDALVHSHWKIRLQALELLIKDHQKDLLDTLLPMLSDPANDIRLTAMSEVASYGDNAIMGLADILRSNDLTARESAIQALLAIGSSATVPILIEALLNDESAWIRIPAAQGLGAIGGDDARDALMTALNDSHQDVLDAVRQALQHIGTPQALDAIRKQS